MRFLDPFDAPKGTGGVGLVGCCLLFAAISTLDGERGVDAHHTFGAGEGLGLTFVGTTLWETLILTWSASI